MPSRCSPWGSTWTGVGRRWPASVPGRQVGRGAHGCCGFGSPISSGNPEKIRNFSLFFCDPSLLSDCSTGGRRSRRSGRGPRPRPNLPKEREIFSRSGQPGPAGFPIFGKTESRDHGRWRGREGGVVVGAGLRGGGRFVQNAEKNSILRKGAESFEVLA